MDISGCEDKSDEQLYDEVRQGGRFISFRYTMSFLVWSLHRRSEPVYLPPGRGAGAYGCFFSLRTLLTGWWSPVGPFLTLHTLWVNACGGIDCTDAVMCEINRDVATGRRTNYRKRSGSHKRSKEQQQADAAQRRASIDAGVATAVLTAGRKQTV